MVAIFILLPGLFLKDINQAFENMGGLYIFGALLAFAFAHAAIPALRTKKPDLARPFRLKPNIQIRGRELPLTAIIGLAATIAIWLVIIVIQDYSRWVGLGWMAFGLAAYALFLWRRRVKEQRAYAEEE